LDEIDSNPYVNRGTRHTPNQVVAFYDPTVSSRSNFQLKDTDEPITKPFKNIEFGPAIYPGFIAAVPGAAFIGELI
jgi:hypothetical protein